MLRRLAIRHYALIDHIEWDVEQGWTVLTGETGSGKSILLGALGLVLGARAEGVETREEKCIVEAEFAPSDAVRAKQAGGRAAARAAAQGAERAFMDRTNDDVACVDLC